MFYIPNKPQCDRANLIDIWDKQTLTCILPLARDSFKLYIPYVIYENMYIIINDNKV